VSKRRDRVGAGAPETSSAPVPAKTGVVAGAALDAVAAGAADQRVGRGGASRASSPAPP
jgi:hypothetical protein